MAVQKVIKMFDLLRRKLEHRIDYVSLLHPYGPLKGTLFLAAIWLWLCNSPLEGGVRGVFFVEARPPSPRLRLVKSTKPKVQSPKSEVRSRKSEFGSKICNLNFVICDL